MENHDFTNSISNWYMQSKRQLPWRNTTDPFRIWLSEVIMQQTRIDQGTDYYLRFIDRFETVGDLANASEEEILKMWQGLGYYSRARNLHQAAKHIAHNLNGQFPSAYNIIMQLKGIGPYTAAAIASICFNEPRAAIDGNVYRVLGRCFAIEEPTDTGKGKKIYEQLANQLIDIAKPGDFNQAIMDLGALICTPQKPLCEQCPIQAQCIAFHTGTVQEFPIKKGKVKQKNRYFSYLIIRHEDHIYMRKRTEKDIWQGLCDFPLVETQSAITIEELVESPLLILQNSMLSIQNITQHKSYIHKLSHQTIHATFYEFEVKKPLQPQNDFKIINKKHIFEVAIPRLIEMHLADTEWL